MVLRWACNQNTNRIFICQYEMYFRCREGIKKPARGGLDQGKGGLPVGRRIRPSQLDGAILLVRDRQKVFLGQFIEQS